MSDESVDLSDHVVDVRAVVKDGAETEAEPLCPRCWSPRWVSVSLDGGWTRRAQCVPCGAIHPPVIGRGWQLQPATCTTQVSDRYS